MSRKSIIISLIALAVMIVGIGVAVLYLYADVEPLHKKKNSQMTDGDRHLVLSAVPSDAVLAACFSDARTVAPQIIAGLEWPEDVRKGKMAFSLHYSGKLIPLYVFETRKDADETGSLVASLNSKGLFVDNVEGFVIASPSETVLKSSVRHISKKVSVMDAAGFDEALAHAVGDDVLFVSNAHVNRLLPVMLTGTYSRNSEFFKRLSDWLVFDISRSSDAVALDGSALFDTDATDFMTVLQKSVPSVSAVSSVLPSYTLFAVSMPMKETAPYVSAYQSYLDTRQKLQANIAARQGIQKRYGSSPEEIVSSMGVREVAAAFFMRGGKMEKITLMRTGRNAQYVDSVDYSVVSAALFGDFFSCKGASETTFVNGWIVSGSKDVIDEYKSGKATEYTLKNMLSDTGKGDLLAQSVVSAVAYFSFSEDSSALKNIFATSFLNRFASLYQDAEIAPAVLRVVHGKKGMELDFDLLNLSLLKTNEAVFERDTTIVIPKGPFKVKNSGTGKMNEFYQNSHNALCLREDGKDLWGIPFSKPICGRAGTVDFYANGKLQILFGAGSSIHLLDRLGRYVTGFPLDLKKEILLGPDIYDFSGKRKYNILVLHKDNTIEMYNLQGVRPASWSGITVGDETIMNLPERIDLGGSTFWIVRTSVQTLIFPFYGGEPLTKFEGNQRIRPDSEINKIDGTTIEFTSYDGKVRTIALK